MPRHRIPLAVGYPLKTFLEEADGWECLPAKHDRTLELWPEHLRASYQRPNVFRSEAWKIRSPFACVTAQDLLRLAWRRCGNIELNFSRALPDFGPWYAALTDLLQASEEEIEAELTLYLLGER